jgi:hypothetical protein
MKLLILVASVLLQILVTSASNDYYWRDFSSEISKDAVPGGKDAAGKQTYIGQTYIHNLGVFVMQITPGVTNPDFAAYGVKKPGPVIKVAKSKSTQPYLCLSLDFMFKRSRKILLDHYHLENVSFGHYWQACSDWGS